MSRKIGFLFPGQGAQFVGMGKDIYEDSSKAKNIYDQADQILGYSLSQICFEGPEEKLTQTIYAQPAIFVTSIAFLATLQKKYPGLEPSLTAGLSLGEFTALVANHSISFENGLKLVTRRAQAMEKSAQDHPGTMASIMGMTQSDCEVVAKESGSELANLNALDQFVLSGSVESIEKACQIAEAKGAKRALRLKVGGAFHSSLMREAKENLEAALKETPIQKPSATFIPNVLGTPVSNPEEIRTLLSRQLMSSVQWIKTMQTIVESKMDLLIEIGPGKVLRGLARKHDKSLNVENCGTMDELQFLEKFFQAV